MTREQVKRIVATIAATWPQFNNGRNPETTVNIWSKVFEDDDFQAVGHGLMVYIATDTSGFPPSPGQIRAMMPRETPEIDEGTAVALIAEAASNGAYDSEKEFRKLPEMLQRIVGAPSQLREWAMMDSDEFQSVILSHIRRNYRTMAEKEEKFQALPASLKKMLPAVTRIGLMEPEKREPIQAEPPVGALGEPMSVGEARAILEQLREASKPEYKPLPEPLTDEMLEASRQRIAEAMGRMSHAEIRGAGTPAG